MYEVGSHKTISWVEYDPFYIFYYGFLSPKNIKKIKCQEPQRGGLRILYTLEFYISPFKIIDIIKLNFSWREI